MSAPTLSLIVPVYRNSENIDSLLRAIAELHQQIPTLEAVFVVDGSPDDSHPRLQEGLKAHSFPAQLLRLARNFGSFSAIRAGLGVGTGEFFAVMAADLQEPPELIVNFYEILSSGNFDVCLGTRQTRDDPAFTRLSANLFWSFYRKLVLSDVPPGGVDIFACTRDVRDQLLKLKENNSSLVGLLLWVGFRRALVPYARRKRTEGKSAWTFRKKAAYLLDSVFSFSDLPIRVLSGLGLVGLSFSLALGVTVVGAKLANQIPVQGYTATIIVVSFFGGLNCLGLGMLGGYVWRTFENTKNRPNYIVAERQQFTGGSPE